MTVPTELRVRHHIQNVYIRRVDKVGTVYQNTVIETSPSVSQFWKDNPEEDVRQPTDSRDNPPCTHCQTRRGDP